MHVTGGDSTGPAPARRSSISQWRNPRLVLGVALVLGSAVLGGWLVATARDTTDYWLVSTDVRAGQPIVAGDLTTTAGRIDTVAAGALIVADDGVPHGWWSRDVAAGTLATRDAVTDRSEPGRELPLSVEEGAVPPDLAPGDLADVWVGRSEQNSQNVPTRRFLTAVPVLSVTSADGTGLRTIVVDAGADGPSADTVTAASVGRLTVVRVP